jgi:uncharacterized protein (DUF433 family)
MWLDIKPFTLVWNTALIGTEGKMSDEQALLDRISVDPAVMVGKPVVRGTRVTVELVLGFLAANPDLDELFAAYPHLTIDDVKACLAYARAAVHRQRRRRPVPSQGVRHTASA